MTELRLGRAWRLQEVSGSTGCWRTRKFAADPVGELRRYLLSEELTSLYLEGLRKAGLELTGGG